MKSIKKSIFALSLIALSACGAQSNYEVEKLNVTGAIGTPFTKFLTAEYRAYSNHEQYSEKDYVDAIHFARKGLAAAQGELVMPEPLEDWNLSEAHYAELGEAREMLVTVLENGARELVADKAAVAQARFDCWVENQEDNWNATDIPCRNEFYSLLNELQALVKPPAPPVVAAPAFPEPIQEVAPAPEPVKIEEALFITFFDWDKSNLTSGANDVLDAAAAEILARSDVTKIIITGHADTSGPLDYNQKLSMRRAQAVKSGLVTRGVNEDMIVIGARGESELLVQTADNVREPANRRVQISLE